ncbi:hypothetical protein ACN38_g5450, partial [Penicillium nordicum]
KEGSVCSKQHACMHGRLFNRFLDDCRVVCRLAGFSW